MTYHVEFSKGALKQLKKMNKSESAMILGWIRKNLENCTNPRIQGKALTGDKKGLWRYRIGDYRLITDIIDNKVVILVLNIGHRKDIYKK